MRYTLGVIVLALAGMLAGAPARALEEHACFTADTERRIQACTELIETPGTSPERLSMAYAMRALSYSLRGEYETAIKDYDQAIALMPNYAVALNNRAWAYYKWGKAANAAPDVELSLMLDPTSPHALDTRAHVKQYFGDQPGALRDYEAAMRFGGQRMIKLYQCGLAQNKLYDGEIDGNYTPIVRRAMQLCIEQSNCDPLPPDEECRIATS
jgi:tetratricopeptide (TPR) repeat protein